MKTTYKLYRNKTSLKKRFSRLLQGGITEQLQKRLGWWEKDSTFVQERVDDITFTITPQTAARPDLISFSIYGTSMYDWIVLQYNNIVDIQEELVVGKTVRAPSLRVINSSIITKTVR